VRLNHVPARDHVASGELFEDHAGERTHIQSIHLHQIAGPGNRVLLGFADGVGTRAQSAATAGEATTGCFHQPALPLQLGEYTATMEVETESFCWRSRTTSLSLPQRG
jgi:hypothetical protein